MLIGRVVPVMGMRYEGPASLSLNAALPMRAPKGNSELIMLSDIRVWARF